MDGAQRLRRAVARGVRACALGLALPLALCAQAPLPVLVGPAAGGPAVPACGDPVGCEAFAPGGFGPAVPGSEPLAPTGPRPWLLQQLDLRHSSKSGRAIGPGGPLRGTSWINRPFWFALDGGALLMASQPAPNVRTNNDLLGAASLGWDWDHYWGTQVRVAWATPELVNSLQPDGPSGDNLFIADLSALYYPWGDSRLRPYYRTGVGLTDVEYTTDSGLRQQDSLFTIPLAIGLKHQFRRSLAGRLEVADNVAIGQNGTGTLHNFTITGGVEWRLGGRPEGEFGYRPRSGAW